MSLILLITSSPFFFFFFNDTATTEIYTLSLHDALPISKVPSIPEADIPAVLVRLARGAESVGKMPHQRGDTAAIYRSEEHTSELQSRQYLVCRLLLEKKKKKKKTKNIQKNKKNTSHKRT